MCTIMSVKINTLIFFAVLAVLVNCDLNSNGQYEVESSNNETGPSLPEVIEQADNNFGDVTMAIDGLTTPPVTEAVTPNITTKPTWIQRIPKKKPKQSGT